MIIETTCDAAVLEKKISADAFSDCLLELNCDGMQAYTEFWVDQLLGNHNIPRVSFDQVNSITSGMRVCAFSECKV